MSDTPNALDEIRRRLSAFYSPQHVEWWLRATHMMLGWRTPLACIDSGHAEDVLRVVEQLETGSYV